MLSWSWLVKTNSKMLLPSNNIKEEVVVTSKDVHVLITINAY